MKRREGGPKKTLGCMLGKKLRERKGQGELIIFSQIHHIRVKITLD